MEEICGLWGRSCCKLQVQQNTPFSTNLAWEEQIIEGNPALVEMSVNFQIASSELFQPTPKCPDLAVDTTEKRCVGH